MENKFFLGKKTENLIEKKYNYFCSVCGNFCIKSERNFDNLPHRKTDDSIICILNNIKIENNLKKSDLIIIHRGNNKYEKQFTFVCKNCGILIAYQSQNFENEEIEEKNKKLLELFNKQENKIIYFLNDALLLNPNHSSLNIEIEKIKNGKINYNSISTKNYRKNLKIKRKLKNDLF